MLSYAERDAVLNTALEKYRPGQSEPILAGGKNLLKPGPTMFLVGPVPALPERGGKAYNQEYRGPRCQTATR
jgi:hypothetical protein